ncbi:MAG: recombinase family protein, partial [bacterium]|nr:recombinase family protein [bacterium]
MSKYFLYIRKSTDEDDRQVLSLEAQETELREFAQKERLNIVSVFRESKTAKDPGRPIFNEMLLKIENGEADGIISWHPDRLARNSVDGGKIIFLLDSEKIKFLKFPTFWFESTPQGKFMLNIAFGQSKYFVDNLSENVKRGLRQKLRRGEMPGQAPLGYLNDLRTHTIVVDHDRFKLVRKIFELYSTGDYSLKDLKNKMESIGLFSRKNYVLSVSTIQDMLKNTFYYGLFKYNGEMHQGKHKTMITKKLFEKCQEVMVCRARPQKRKIREFAFRGIFFCGECGCSITSEMQKGHNYYRCTKKRVKCNQKYAREEVLDEQISDIIQKVSLPESWYYEIILELEKGSEQEYKDSVTFVQNLKNEIEKCEEKLDKLLDEKLDETIDKEEYILKKNKILNKKLE